MARPGHRTAGDRVAASKHRRPPADHRSRCRRVRLGPPARLRRASAGARAKARPAHLSVRASPVLVSRQSGSPPTNNSTLPAHVPKPSAFSRTAGSRNSRPCSTARAATIRPCDVLTKLAAQHNQQRTTQSIADDRYEIRWEKSTAPALRRGSRRGIRPGSSSAMIADAVQPLVDALTARGHRHRIRRVAGVRRGRGTARSRVARCGSRRSDATHRACRGPRLRTPHRRCGHCCGCNTESWAERGGSSAPPSPPNCADPSGW